MKNFFVKCKAQVKKKSAHLDGLGDLLFVVVLILTSTLSGVRAFQIGSSLVESGQISLTSAGILLGLLFAVLGFSIQKYYTIKSGNFVQRQARRMNDLNRLSRICDLIPTPCLRQRIKKLLADQEAHLIQLKRGKRLWAARWIVLTTWILVAWYVLASPVTALTQAIAGGFKGAGD